MSRVVVLAWLWQVMAKLPAQETPLSLAVDAQGSIIRTEQNAARSMSRGRKHQKHVSRKRILPLLKNFGRTIGNFGRTIGDAAQDALGSVGLPVTPPECRGFARKHIKTYRGTHRIESLDDERPCINGQPKTFTRKPAVLEVSKTLHGKDVIFIGDITIKAADSFTGPLLEASSVKVFGTLRFQCPERHGRCLCLKTPNLTVQSLSRGAGFLSFELCAVQAADITQPSGQLRFSRAAVHVYNSLTQTGGKIVFSSCDKVAVGSISSSKGGVLEFSDSRDSTCLEVRRRLSLDYGLGGHAMFRHCRHTFSGAILYFGNQSIVMSGSVRFENCSASRNGGKGVLLAPFLNAQVEGFDLENVRCPLGSHVVQGVSYISCQTCAAGYIHVDETSSKACADCPKHAAECTPSKLKMRAGYMVQDLHNTSLNQPVACPNPSACRGEAPGGMCEEGYAGAGCADCADSHAASDGSALACVRCPESVGSVFFHLLLWLGRLTGLFALATKSVLESEGDAKASSVYLNQLLSFSTVSGTILAALLQTPIGQEMRSGAVGLLFSAAALITDLASGQGSGSESTGQSLQCTLSFFGMGPAMWKGHLAFVFVTTALTCSLAAMKGRQAALVIGINCFFPEFLSHFGRQLVCYRLGRDKDLLCPHVPTFLGTVAGFCLVAGCAMAFTAAVFGTWWYLYRTTPSTRSKKHKASEHPKPLPEHVCFLTAPYRKQFAKWETERLVRKSVFTFAAAALPVCASPAMQLSILGLVALASLVLYAVLLPYTDPRWNMTEVAQLTTCVATIFPVMSLLVSDVHWGESKLVQLIVVTFTAILDAGICSCLFYLTVTNMLRERAKKTHNPSKTAVKPAEPLPEYPPGLQAHFPPGLQMPSSSQQAGRMQIVSPNHMPASHYPAGSRTTPAAPEPGTWQVMHPDLPPGILQGRPHGDLPQYPPGILPVMHPPPPDAVAIGRQASNAPPGPATPKNTAHPGAPAPAG